MAFVGHGENLLCGMTPTKIEIATIIWQLLHYSLQETPTLLAPSGGIRITNQ